MSDVDFDQNIPDHSEQILDMVNKQLLNPFVDINEMVIDPSDHIAQLDKMVRNLSHHIAYLRKMVSQSNDSIGLMEAMDR